MFESMFARFWMDRGHMKPRYKLILMYDIVAGENDKYFQFVVREFVPAVQDLGLYLWRVYHTAYGERPLRQVEFLAESLETVQTALSSPRWQSLEGRLEQYITNYTRKLVSFRDGFQF
jgi:hypothetical protein